MVGFAESAQASAGKHALHRRREEAALDPTVRDTWEVSRDLVTVDAPALDEALAEIADELGAQKGCRLEAELHAMIGTPNGSDGAPRCGHPGRVCHFGRHSVTNHKLSRGRLAGRRPNSGRRPVGKGWSVAVNNDGGYPQARDSV
jgi:hypothetical protein